MSEPRDGSPEPPRPTSSVPWLPADLDVEAPPRITPRRLLSAAVSLALVVALLVWVLPWVTGADWPGILAALTSLPPWALPTVAVLGAAAIGLEALTVRTAVRGSRYGTALQGNASANALALAIPGGSMLGMGLLGWLLRRSGLALPVIITGLIAASLVETVITSVVIPVVGLGSYALSSVLAGPGIQLPGAVGAAIAAVAASVIALALTAIALNRRVLTGVLDQLGQVIDLPRVGPPDEDGGGTPEATEDGMPETTDVGTDAGGTAGRHPFIAVVLTQREELLRLLRTRAFALLAPVSAARLLQWAALLVAIEAVGAQVPLLLTVAVFALGRALSLVPITPGGAGIAETVSAAALIALGAGAEAAATAMLLSAVATLVMPLLIGGGAAVAAVAHSPSS